MNTNELRHKIMDELNTAMTVLEEARYAEDAYEEFYHAIVDINNMLADLDVEGEL